MLEIWPDRARRPSGELGFAEQPWQMHRSPLRGGPKKLQQRLLQQTPQLSLLTLSAASQAGIAIAVPGLPVHSVKETSDKYTLGSVLTVHKEIELDPF